MCIEWCLLTICSEYIELTLFQKSHKFSCPLKGWIRIPSLLTSKLHTSQKFYVVMFRVWEEYHPIIYLFNHPTRACMALRVLIAHVPTNQHKHQPERFFESFSCWQRFSASPCSSNLIDLLIFSSLNNLFNILYETTWNKNFKKLKLDKFSLHGKIPISLYRF